MTRSRRARKILVATLLAGGALGFTFQQPVAGPTADYGKRICEWDGWLPPEVGRTRYLAARELTRDEDDVYRLALQSRNPQRRDAAARKLAASRDPRSLDALLGLERDSSSVVREGMLRSLGRIGSVRAEPVLLRAMVEKDKHIRQAAAWSLGQLRSRGGLSVLTAATRDESEQIRSEAAWALGMIGDKSAIPTVSLLNSDPAKAVRIASVCAIGWLGGEVQGAALRDTSTAVRAAVAWSAARVK